MMTNLVCLLHLHMRRLPVRYSPVFHTQRLPVRYGPVSHTQRLPVRYGPVFHTQRLPVRYGPVSHTQRLPVRYGPVSHTQRLPVRYGHVFHTQRTHGCFSCMSIRSLATGNDQSDRTNTKKKRPWTRRHQAGLLLVVPLFTLLPWCIYKVTTLKPKRDSDRTKKREIYFDRYCSGRSGGLVKYERFWLPLEFFSQGKTVKDIRNFRLRADDIIVASFPKSDPASKDMQLDPGSQDAKPDPGSQDSTLEDHFPYLEYVYPGLKALHNREGQRLLKTHLPYEFLPEDAQNGLGKVIYVARNVKDVTVSYFHFLQMLTVTRYKGSFNHFFNSFVQGKVAYGPWPDHVLQYWTHQGSDNLLFVTYEDLHRDPVGVVKQISEFLGRPISDITAVTIAYRCSFKQMRSDDKVNYSWWDDLGIRDKTQTHFMRKGMVGDWVNYYTPEMARELDEKYREAFKQHGLLLTDQ